VIPLASLPGFGAWGGRLAEVLASDQPLWVEGASGAGVTCVGAELAQRRQSVFLDDAELLEASTLRAWLASHPRGVAGGHGAPALEGPFLVLRLPALEEVPGDVGVCLEAMAAAEGVPLPLPAVLGRLPCPGQLRGLHNRLLRWKLLGQLPQEAPASPGGLPLAEDDLATNLHLLERLLLHRALRRSYGNRVEAAHRLGVSRRQLYLLIARHGDPLRGQSAVSQGLKRMQKRATEGTEIQKGKFCQNSSRGEDHR
jgi:hypothetical protein